MARRAGAILAVADVERSVAFYRDDRASRSRRSTTIRRTRRSRSRAPGSRSPSRATRRGPARSRGPAPTDPSRADVVLVVEVDDARAEHARLADGVRILAEPYEPPWGGCRFFCVDPDGYLVEIEQPA